MYGGVNFKVRDCFRYRHYFDVIHGDRYARHLIGYGQISAHRYTVRLYDNDGVSVSAGYDPVVCRRDAAVADHAQWVLLWDRFFIVYGCSAALGGTRSSISVILITYRVVVAGAFLRSTRFITQYLEYGRAARRAVDAFASGSVVEVNYAFFVVPSRLEIFAAISFASASATNAEFRYRRHAISRSRYLINGGVVTVQYDRVVKLGDAATRGRPVGSTAAGRIFVEV